MEIRNLEEFVKPLSDNGTFENSPDLTSCYNSPITLLQGQFETKIENDVMTAIQRYGIDVNKEELLKALAYDRHQYEEGYKNGYQAGYEKAKKDFADMILRYPM